MSNKTIQQIKNAIPEIESEKVNDYADALDRVLVIKRIFQSEDGKELIKELQEVCFITINKLLFTYKNNPDLPTLISLISILDSHYSMLSKIKDISLEKELREQLDEAVREAYRE